MTTALDAIAFKAQTHPQHRFQNVFGTLNADALYRGWANLNKQSAPGIDGVTAAQYEAQLADNIHTLADRLKQGHYRAGTIKRVFIPKGNGKLRPLGLPTLDDKIVQQSVSEVLQSIWEQDFLRNSYGYRPHKSAHQAVHGLQLNLQFRGYGYIVEADIKGFFDNMDHAWLMRMLRQRIDDQRLLSLIGQWLKAPIRTPEGACEKPHKGTPQGGVISPVLANIYLHYVLDLWFEYKIKPALQGRAMLVRYADDFVVAFQYHRDAEDFYRALGPRLATFGLELAPEKTALKRFTRFQPGYARRFEFLGFEFYWDTDRSGEARLRRKTAPKKHKAALQTLYDWIKRHRHQRLSTLIAGLKRKLAGFYNYFALVDNGSSVWRVFSHVLQSLHKWLNRRSQRRSFTWQGMKEMLAQFGMRPPRIYKLKVAVDWY